MTLPQLCSFIVLQQNYKGFACQILFPCCFKQTNSNVCVAHIKFEASRGRSLSNTNRIVSTMEPIPWLRRLQYIIIPTFTFYPGEIQLKDSSLTVEACQRLSRHLHFLHTDFISGILPAPKSSCRKLFLSDPSPIIALSCHSVMLNFVKIGFVKLVRLISLLDFQILIYGFLWVVT